MEIQTRKDKQFSVEIGKKAPDTILPPMPIRIHYIGVELDYSLEMIDGQEVFRESIPKEFTPGWDCGAPWDCYKLREQFENLGSHEDARGLLNVIGTFRLKRGRSRQANLLPWRELQGWQEILRRLRQRDSSEWFPLLGVQDRDFKSTFSRGKFIAELGSLSEQIWSVSEETFGWLQGFPQGLSIERDRFLSREETEGIFSAPGARVRGSRAWHEAQLVLARRRDERARGNAEGKQKLIAQVTPATALDAILATVYVDKLRGIDFQVCALKECNETFERQSAYGKIYCSNYHAHLASIRRKRAEEKEIKAKRNRKKEKAK